MNSAVVTVYHDVIADFFNAYLASLESQIDQQFKLLIFDDSLNGLKLSSVRFQGQFEIIKLPKMTLLENRLWIINFVKEVDVENFHFCDGDDLLEENYLKTSNDLLNQYPFVVHDFHLMSHDGNIIEKNYWGQRLTDGFTFDWNYLLDKNIVGLGNTSITSSLLQKCDLGFSNIVTIPDWFIFFQLLHSSKEEVIFNSTSSLMYRQHRNLGVLKDPSYEQTKKNIAHVYHHFEGLKEIGCLIDDDPIENLSKLSETYDQSTHNNYLLARQSIHYFWWEEVFTILRHYDN